MKTAEWQANKVKTDVKNNLKIIIIIIRYRNWKKRNLKMRKGTHN